MYPDYDDGSESMKMTEQMLLLMVWQEKYWKVFFRQIPERYLGKPIKIKRFLKKPLKKEKIS